MKKNRLIWIISLLFVSTQLFAQNISVGGQITDASNSEGLVGVTVTVKGASLGTVSDFDGNYSLNVPSNATLVFKYLGYITQEVSVNNRSIINISMSFDQEELEEVVVVGTILKKSDLTGAVGSVSAKKLTEKPVVSVNQALQGLVAGVSVNSAAKPGDDSSLKIRGVNTINGGTDPIYVVDGLVMDNFGGGFNSINVNDIESIEVMKDASSTALYGSRGSNGVIVITTKKGKKGEGKVNYDGWFGVRKNANMPKSMNSKQLFELRRDAAINGYKAAYPNATETDVQNFIANRVMKAYNPSDASLGGFLFGQYELDAYADPNFKDYDWLDQVTRDGFEQNHAVSFSGATDKGSFFMSFGYSDQQGMIKKLSDEKYTGRINSDYNIKSWLKVGTNTSFQRSISEIFDNDGVYDRARGANPMLPIKEGEDMLVLNYGDYYDQNYFNPLNTHKIDNDRIRNRFITSNFININPLPGINFRSTYSLEFFEQSRFRYTPNNIQEAIRYTHNGEVYHSRDQRTMWQWENSLSYDKTFDVHRINAMVATSASKTDRNYTDATGKGFDTNIFDYYTIGASNQTANRSISSDFYTYSLMSYVVRANYTYNNKYYVTATGRYDGSSRFAGGNRWGFFPSFSLAWDMVQEDFMKDINFLDQLKLRVGGGRVGNQEIDNYAFYTQFSPTLAGPNATGLSRPDRMGNKDLRWEAQQQINIGFDASFLNNRLRLTADYFQVTNSDLLMVRSAWNSLGHNNFVENVGKMENKGFEFTVEGKIVNTADIQWNLSANISRDNNKVKELTDGVPYILKYDDDRNLQKEGNLFVGKPRNSIYIWKTGGIAREEDMERLKDMNWNGRKVNPGDIYPLDISGPDGIPDGKIDDNDRTLINSDPKFYGGFSSDFTYKGITLNAVFTYSYGGKKLSYLYESMTGSTGRGYTSTDLLDRWSEDNKGAKYPRPLIDDPSDQVSYNTFSPNQMDQSIQNSSYLRLSALTLAYTLPKKVTDSIKLGSLRFYTTASNLFCITSYKGYDPEMGDWYPPTRMFVFGMNLSF